MKAIAAIVGSFIVMPIWFFLLYRILQSVNASELMWFLYWIYVPAAILTGIIIKLSKDT